MMFSLTPDGRPRPLAVGRVDQHPGHRTGALLGVEDPDLVVGQVDAAQHRVGPGHGHGLAQGLVQGVDRAVALGGGDDPLALDLHLDRRLGDDLGAVHATGAVGRGPVLHRDPEGLQLEEGLDPSPWRPASGARGSRRPPRSGSPRTPAASAGRRRRTAPGRPSPGRSPGPSARGSSGRPARTRRSGCRCRPGRGRRARRRRAAERWRWCAGPPCGRTPTAPTKACWGSGLMLTSSATWWATGVRRSRRSTGIVATPIFRERSGMIVVRLQLPVRSP